MEMCYDGALVMPSSYVVMNEEEMTYLDGGTSYTTYKGNKAWVQISKMMMSVSTWAGTTKNLIAAAAGSSATGVGLVIAVVAALGASLTAASAGVQVCMTALAMGYTIADGGFKCAEWGIFSWSYNFVKPL